MEKKKKYGRGNKKAQLLRNIPGGRQIFNAAGEVELTIEDVKAGRKLNLMSQFGATGSKAEEYLEAKLAYYKNLKPRGGVFKT